MRPRFGFGGIATLTLLALVIGGSYTAYAGGRLYQSLQSGRHELAAAQADINAAQPSGDLVRLRAAAAQLTQAEQDFTDAQQRARTDPGLRLAGSVSGSGQQVDAAGHLAAIGADLSRAGEAAAAIGVGVAELKQEYAGRQLTPADLAALLQRAQALTSTYQGSVAQIGKQLEAAHAERSQVTTTNLVPPLRSAYDEVDRALADADTAFLRYQDVRQVLSELLGVPLPA